MTSLLQILLAVCVGLGIIALAGVIFLRKVWFFRDPVRVPDSTEGVLIAPADGMVVYVRRLRDGKVVSEKLGERIDVTEITHCGGGGGEGWMLGIYMSPLDVHYNYCPADCLVESIHHVQADLNLPMIDAWEYVRIVWLRRLVQLFGRRFHLENERTTFMLNSNGIRLALVLIADKFVNKITTFVSTGDRVSMGAKMAFIARGSQADVALFHPGVEIVVKPGQRVKGGKSVIARLTPASAHVDRELAKDGKA